MRNRFGRSRHCRFVPRLEQLHERALPSVSVVETGSTLVVRGDQFANDIVITDDGTSNAGNVVVQIDGQTYTSQGAITTIRIAAGSGSDSVEYNLSADLLGSRTVNAYLGNGDDTFLSTVHSNLNDPASLLIRAWGGNGEDSLSLDGIGANVGAGGKLAVVFAGGNGKDSIDEEFSGVLMGDASFKAYGGNGKDVVVGNLNADLTSNSETGETAPSTGSLTARFCGGNGVDAMTLNVTGADDLTTRDLRLNGGLGKDTFENTDNVTVVDLPKAKK